MARHVVSGHQDTAFIIWVTLGAVAFVLALIALVAHMTLRSIRSAQRPIVLEEVTVTEPLIPCSHTARRNRLIPTKPQ